MPRLLTAVIAIGAAWGLVASGVHLAIFSGLLSPPGDLPLPFAITLLLLDLRYSRLSTSRLPSPAARQPSTK